MGVFAMRWKCKGSLTVEAAFIGVFSVVAAGLVLSFWLYVYQRCWYTQAACEIAMTAGGQEIFEDNETRKTANEKWAIMQTECYPKPHALSGTITDGKDEVNLAINGTTPIWGRDGLALSVKVSQKKVRPVSYVRKMAALMQKE